MVPQAPSIGYIALITSEDMRNERCSFVLYRTVFGVVVDIYCIKNLIRILRLLVLGKLSVLVNP